MSTESLLRLCARPEGLRVDQTGLDDLARLTGKHHPRTTVSSRMAKMQAKGLVTMNPGAKGRPGLYTLTERGQAKLEDTGTGRKPNRRPRNPSPKPIQLTSWRRAPVKGDPRPIVMPVIRVESLGVSSGVDVRYQCTAQESANLKLTGYYSSGAYRHHLQSGLE